MTKEGHVITASEAGIAVKTPSDISDVISACIGKYGLILTPDDLSPEFFDLRTGLAGELFQKCVNYRVRIAIIVPDPNAYGDRFSELAYEHQSHDVVRIVPSEDNARAWLSR